jgi:hypothetical protein
MTGADFTSDLESVVDLLGEFSARLDSLLALSFWRRLIARLAHPRVSHAAPG